MDDLPGRIESLDDGGERETHADVTESHHDVLMQSAQSTATATPLDMESQSITPHLPSDFVQRHT